MTISTTPERPVIFCATTNFSESVVYCTATDWEKTKTKYGIQTRPLSPKIPETPQDYQWAVVKPQRKPWWQRIFG